MTHAPMETRGCVARWDVGRGELVMHTGTQVPHPYRTQLAARLRLGEDQVRVIVGDVGGAFGQNSSCTGKTSPSPRSRCS